MFGFIVSGLLSIMVGKSWRQELKATGHIASAIRKQRNMNADAQVCTPDRARVAPTFEVSCRTSMNIMQKLPHRHTQGFVFSVISDPATVTIEVKPPAA